MPDRIIQGWSSKPAGRLVRPAGFAMLLAGSLLATASAAAAASPAGLASAIESSAVRSEERPRWFAPNNEGAAQVLIEYLETSNVDGIEPGRFNIGALRDAVGAAWGGRRSAVGRAETMLDRALVAYATSLRATEGGGWIVVDRDALPKMPTPAEILADAASAPSLQAWLEAMPFMHHSYAELRRSLLRSDPLGPGAELLRLNLERSRMLPATGRYVMVNTAAQRLFIYENGKVVDSMRVVVGKPEQPTPMMAALIRFTAINPYWNVPPDLAAERVAPHVVKQGLGYLREQGYVVLSDWSDNAVTVDPSTIDWEAVAAGRIQVRLRQEPGPNNSMGEMKFMFPNRQGIYLHDTPNKELLNEDARLFSGGCVRLEDAPRLAAWLYGRPLETEGARPEQPVPLDKPVPVYLTYMTAVPSGDTVVYYDDIYGRDRAQLAAASEGRIAVR